MRNYESFSYYTFGMITPEGMEHKEEIVRMILEAGLKIDYYKCDILTDDLIEKTYGHFKEKSSEEFQLIKENLKSGPVLMMIIYDNKAAAVEKYKNVLGHTNNSQTGGNTIRDKFKSTTKSFIGIAYGSSSPEAANNEICAFFGNEISNIFHDIGMARRLELSNDLIKNKNKNPQDSYWKSIADGSYYIDSTINDIEYTCKEFERKQDK